MTRGDGYLYCPKCKVRMQKYPDRMAAYCPQCEGEVSEESIAQGRPTFESKEEATEEELDS